MDPQGNASTGLGVAADKRSHSVYQVLLDSLPIGEAVTPTLVPGMDIVPSGVDLSGAELELIAVPRSEYRLREAVQGPRGTYDFVILHCPSALGLAALNSIVWASR